MMKYRFIFVVALGYLMNDVAFEADEINGCYVINHVLRIAWRKKQKFIGIKCWISSIVKESPAIQIMKSICEHNLKQSNAHLHIINHRKHSYEDISQCFLFITWRKSITVNVIWDGRMRYLEIDLIQPLIIIIQCQTHRIIKTMNELMWPQVPTKWLWLSSFKIIEPNEKPRNNIIINGKCCTTILAEANRLFRLYILCTFLIICK